MITLCNLISTIMIYKILKKKTNPKMARIGAYLFITSGVLLFSSIIVNQLDAIYLMFMMIGFYFLICKEKLGYFSLFIGISASYKYIPILVSLAIIPLLEKKPLKIIKNYIIMILPILFFNLLMKNNSGYQQSMLLVDFFF